MAAPQRLGATVLFLLSGCGMPVDPEGTSERIARTHQLRVGVSDNPPWTSASGGEPSGIEPTLMRQFAAGKSAKVVWSRGSETTLVQSLKQHELDVVLGGFEKKTQWSSTVGITQPFAKDAERNEHVLLAAPGENGFILELDRFLVARKRVAQAQ